MIARISPLDGLGRLHKPIITIIFFIHHDLFQRWGEDAGTGQRIHPLTRAVA